MEPRVARPLMLAGVVLILLVGLIHLIDAPDSMSESTTKGLSFYANFVGAIVAALGIFMHRTWGWSLGTLVAPGRSSGTSSAAPSASSASRRTCGWSRSASRRSW